MDGLEAVNEGPKEGEQQHLGHSVRSSHHTFLDKIYVSRQLLLEIKFKCKLEIRTWDTTQIMSGSCYCISI